MPDRTIEGVLLERAASGDSAAFLQVYERHRDTVFRFAYRLSGTIETAEDITHDCFLGLLQRPLGFDSDRASLKTYLLSAARNLWLKQLRKTARELAIEELSNDGFEPFVEAPVHALLTDELASRVRQAVLSLPALQREAVILFEYEQLPLSEIAKMVDTDVGTIKSRLHRARANLRQSLNGVLDNNRELATLGEGLR